MIDTDKIMRTTKILLHGRHISKNEADDYLEIIAEVKRLREDNKKLHDAINGCAYANMQGSALDLYCESIIERCPTCDENIESGLCNDECGCEEE